MVPSQRTTRVHGQEEPTITPYRDRLTNGDYLPKPEKAEKPEKPEPTKTTKT